MEFKEENSLYDCIKPLPIEGGFNISDHHAHIAVILELCREDTDKENLKSPLSGSRTITIDEFDRWLEDGSNSIGWDAKSILAHRSKIIRKDPSDVLRFSAYFKLKHKHRGKNLKKFGV